MSKSLGNSPDPLDLFDKYGVDAVRVSILLMAPQGTDILFSENKIDLGRNFMNKLWNCSRYLMMNIKDKKDITTFNDLDKESFELVDLWILSRLNTTINDINKLLDQYNYEKDWLKKMMKIQETNNDLHAIDYRMIKKGNTLNRLSGGFKNNQTGTFWSGTI